MIYCGKKTDLYNFKRTYLPKDLIVEFRDDGSDTKVRMKTGRENYSAPYPELPYLGCDCNCSNRYVFNTHEKKDKWIIKHEMKRLPNNTTL